MRGKFAADPHAVYTALTTRTGLAACWTDQLEVAEQVGGVSRFGFGPDWAVEYDMRVDELTPDRAVLWTCVAGNPEWVGTTVRWDIVPSDGRVEVRFSHAGWAADTDFKASCAYVWAGITERLSEHTTTGRVNPFFTVA